MTNQELYESDEVVAKYASFNTRNRCLNNAEKIFIDNYEIRNKKVLVIGSGIGRVPSNLLLFGNTVIGVELSSKLCSISKQLFPNSDFQRLEFVEGNAVDLNIFDDNNFDLVFFPQNGLDYIPNIKDRNKAISEMIRVCKPNGIIAFSSLNLIAYCISYKLPRHQKEIKNISKNFLYRKEYVVGGGFRYMSKPTYLINEVLNLGNINYIGFTADVRNGIDFRIAKSLRLSSYVFPWLNYIFKKIG